MVCCWVCGCSKKAKSIQKPDSYPDPPEKIVCPNCGDTTRGVYKQDQDRFWFCFIPCCCTCQSSDPYIACINCQRPLGVITGNKCDNCGLLTTFKSNNCPSCGATKSRV